MLYSQRKKRVARIAHTAVSPSITPIGSIMFSKLFPKNAFFIMVIPCVIGKKLTIFCIIGGIISIGNVVPEKISMGK